MEVIVNALAFSWVVIFVYAAGVLVGRYEEPQLEEQTKYTPVTEEDWDSE